MSEDKSITTGNTEIIKALNALSMLLEKCADDVPYELSAKENLYFRMVDLANEGQTLAKKAKE